MVETIIQLVSPLLGTGAGGAEAAVAGAATAGAEVAATGMEAAGIAAEAAAASGLASAGAAEAAAADTGAAAGACASTTAPVVSKLNPSARDASSFFMSVFSFYRLWARCFKALPCRSRRYGCGPPVRGCRRRFFRHRSCRCGRRLQPLQSRDRPTRPRRPPQS